MSFLDDDPIAAVKTLTLERRRYGASESISRHVYEQMQFKEEFRQDVFDRIVYSIETELLAERLPPEGVERTETFSVAFPSSSWQHFKQEHAGSWWLGWLVRRRPIRLQERKRTATLTVDLERFRTFPKADITYPDRLGPYVNVAYVNTKWSLR